MKKVFKNNGPAEDNIFPGQYLFVYNYSFSDRAFCTRDKGADDKLRQGRVQQP